MTSSKLESASFSESERERRIGLLHDVLKDNDFDVLVAVSANYRGYRGTLRWIADYTLHDRYGYAVLAPGREPEVLVPASMSMGPLGAWDVSIRRIEGLMSDGLVKAVGDSGRPRRIGIMGLGVMRVEDYLALKTAFSQAEIVDASDAFERIRAVKSDEEIEGLREATRIAESCFERLLEITRAGMTEREIGAEMFLRMYELGGEDPILLIMRPVEREGVVVEEISPPSGRVLNKGDLLIFSYGFTGRLGYFMELARMVTLGSPSEVQQHLNAAHIAGTDAGAAKMRAGARPEEVGQAVLDGITGRDARAVYVAGHGLGLDAIEMPTIGVSAVKASSWTIEAQMAITIHPHVTDHDQRGIAYMSDSYVTREGAPAEPVSTLSREIYAV